jgi:hypothetical protein
VVLERRRVWPVAARVCWAVGCLAAYALLSRGVAGTFHIENTSQAMAEAAQGRAETLAAFGALALLALLTLAPPLARGRFPTAAGALIGVPAAAIALLVQVDDTTIAPIVAYLLLSPVMLVGLVLGLLPRRTPRPRPRAAP